MKCPLCGLVFEKETARSSCLGACLWWKKCDLIRCPNCYYENIIKTETDSNGSRSQAFDGHGTLAEWPVGCQAVVKHLKTDDRQALQKLIAMGIFRGSTLELTANYPSFVFKIQNRTFAIDRELADRILVGEP